MACKSSKMKKYKRLPKAQYGLGLNNVGFSENMEAINKATGQNKGAAKPGMGNASSYIALGNSAGELVESFEKPDDPNYGTNIGGGALKGAGTGAAIGSFAGPVGTVIGGAVGAVAGGVSGWVKSDRAEEEMEEAERRRKMAANANRLNQINSDLVNYSPVFENGGSLGGLNTKSPTVPDPEKLAIDSFTYPTELTIDGQKMSLDPFAGDHTTFKNRYRPAIQKQTSTVRDKTLRPKTYRNTIDSAVNDFGMSREEFRANYQDNPEKFIQGLASEMPNKYKAQKNSLGKWSLYEYMPSNAGVQNYENGGQINHMNPSTPIVNDYNGQSHSGPDGGIPVDKNGTPSAMTGNSPVALTEDNEVAYNGYIFSDTLKYKK